ncbi:MAG: AAC(3) family N-acetyltransferase, partial [Oscillospiraceae bacterium]|nr:AAC(3) family N-acetyltransferase [Oscillospiraceae bacterium]
MLEVHCSLSSFGHVDGGALTVIEALKNAVGMDGAIVMPSFKDSPELALSETDKKLGLTLKIRLLKGDGERSGMGIVSDTFRKMPDVVTGEGQFRVSAWGRDAEKHAADWFEYLIKSGGHALLLGVDIYR